MAVAVPGERRTRARPTAAGRPRPRASPRVSPTVRPTARPRAKPPPAAKARNPRPPRARSPPPEALPRPRRCRHRRHLHRPTWARALRAPHPEGRFDAARPRLHYGSTVATNALLERRGARVVLLTTEGFEDVLEIGRQVRPELYALEPFRPPPLVPRARRHGVEERVLADGRTEIPLGTRAIRRAMAAVARDRAEAVAICFLHSYAAPQHERRLGRALAGRGLHVTLSHRLVREYREYERLSTTVVNAFVGPLMARHLRALMDGVPGSVRVMQSSGGLMEVRAAAAEAVRTALSGPAGGVIGAAERARRGGFRHIITLDMGGTSTDVSVVDGIPAYRTDTVLAGLPLRVPSLDIHTVGAGGGSLARIDAGGALKVGPESAGADPGPACYGRGDQPTVTDAQLVLGRLQVDHFLGGRMRLQPERARAALTALGGSADERA